MKGRSGLLILLGLILLVLLSVYGRQAGLRQ